MLSICTDALTLVEALKFVLNIGKQPPFSDILSVLNHPDPSMLSDAELLEYVPSSAQVSKSWNSYSRSLLAIYAIHAL